MLHTLNTAAQPACSPASSDGGPATKPAVHRPRLLGLRRVPPVLMAMRIDANEGLLQLAAVPYDETIIDWIRTLPQRHYRPETQDWSIPARREHLRAVCGVIAELEERAIAVDISETARARLTRADVGRAILRGDNIEIAGPYSERRLPALRALPERRFDAERTIWTNGSSISVQRFG